MLNDATRAVGVDGWVASVAGPSRREWQRIDAQGRRLAKEYLSLEAQLVEWVREAERVKVWKYAGCISMNAYLERVFGFTPRQARDRVLVARRLADLPVLEAALRSGELSYSAVRELSRVAEPATEDAWVAHARGMTLRDVEQAVSQREQGDLPGDPPRPDAAPIRVSFEVKPATYALLQQVTKMLEDERGGELVDDDLVSAILDAVIAPPDAEARKGRAKFMIALTTCISCRRTVQHGGGKTVAVDAGALERAQCDSQCIGSLDAEVPETATQDVPPRVRRLVFQRDGYRCRVPGCRSARFLEVHHIVHREDGGTNAPANLILLCDGHHKLHHDGLLTIGGYAPDHVIVVRGSRRDGAGRWIPGREQAADDDPRGSSAGDRHASRDESTTELTSGVSGLGLTPTAAARQCLSPAWPASSASPALSASPAWSVAGATAGRERMHAREVYIKGTAPCVKRRDHGRPRCALEECRG